MSIKWKRRFKTAVILCGLAAIVFCMAGCGWSDSGPSAGEDEIMLVIQLDLGEDIGLLILDTDYNGAETSGGVSNSDRSLLKRNEVLYWTLSRQEYDDPPETAELALRFRVITQYCDPNYENIYPEEYTVLLDPISFEAEFGETYHITITGDNATGYQVALDHEA